MAAKPPIPKNLQPIPIPLPSDPIMRKRPSDERTGPGSPPWEFTAAGLEYIATCAQAGKSERSIAKMMGIPYNRFRECKKRQLEDVSEALAVGRCARNDEVHDILMQMARSNNVIAAIFIAKAQCGWREGDAPDMRPNVHIHLPAPMSEDEFQRLRETGATPMQLSPTKPETDWDGVEVINGEFDES